MRKKRKRRARTAAEAERRAGQDIASSEPAEGWDAEEEGSEEEADRQDRSEEDVDAEEGDREAAPSGEPGSDAGSGSGGWGSEKGTVSATASAVELDEELAAQTAFGPDGVPAGRAGSNGPASDRADEFTDDPDAELAPAFALEPARLKSVLESLLFASDKPLTPIDLRRLTGFDDAAAIQAALDELVEEYRDRGIPLYDVAGGYQFRTHPSNSEYVQRLIAGRPVRLSRAQLETLAIIAYRQPVTRPEIDEIRGVDSGSTLKVLLDRSLIRVLGKKEEPGRPLLYGTSKEFLEFFNLSELRDLPTLREFHELTDESLAEVEALDQSGREGAEPEAADREVADGDADDGPGDDSSAAAPH